LTAKDYLLQIPALRNRIRAIERRIDDDIDSATCATSRLKAVNISGTGHRSNVETFVCDAIDREYEDLQPLRDAYNAQLMDIRTVLKEFPPGRLECITRLHYLDGRGWEDVAREFGVTTRRVWYLHGDALALYSRIHNRLGMFPRLDSSLAKKG
jgi:DNA-directed RNA polymerase specialized sigma24 family protein